MIVPVVAVVLVATVDLSHDIVLPIFVGTVLFLLSGAFVFIGRRIQRVMAAVERVEGQVKPDRTAVEAGTSELTSRDVQDETVKLIRAMSQTLEDHVLLDDRRFADEDRDLAKLWAVVQDRGTLLAALADSMARAAISRAVNPPDEPEGPQV